MKNLVVLLVAFSALALIFGCAMPPMSPPSSGITVKPIAKANATENATQNSSIGAQENGTVAVPEANQTPDAPKIVEPVLVPRNISDKIYQGQFDIPDPSGSPLVMEVINAGYSDAILVNKGEFYMLIGNGNAELVNQYLKDKGIEKLDVVVATKDTEDSSSGIPQTLDEFGVGEIWDNGNPGVSENYALIRKKAAEKGVPIKHPNTGDVMDLGGLRVFVLNPPNDGPSSNPDHDAITLKLSNGNFCAMLLNPIVQDWESTILNAAENESVKCGVMTYFKHGEGRPMPPVSLEKIAPKDVIISVGANSDGLPSPTTLTWLQLSPDRRVWRTDTNGTIKIVADGTSAYAISAGG